MPSGCERCPKCGEQTLQPDRGANRAYCLRVIDCAYSEKRDPDLRVQLQQAQEERGQLLQRLYFKSWIMMGMFQGLKDFMAQRDAAIERLGAMELVKDLAVAEHAQDHEDLEKVAGQLVAAERRVRELEADAMKPGKKPIRAILAEAQAKEGE